MSRMEMNNFNLVRKESQLPINTLTELLRDYFANHKGVVTYALLTTYDGMDITVLEDLLLTLPGGNQLIAEGRMDICCGAKKALSGYENSYLSELLLARVHRVCVENAFHPKIILLKYSQKGEEEERIFMIISSKNITRSTYLDAYVCFEGVKTEGDGNGKQLKEIFAEESFWGNEEVAKQIGESLENLGKYQFTSLDEKAEVSFYRPDEDLFNSIVERKEGDPKAIVVSPFVTDEKWEGTTVCLYTSEETARGLTEKPSGDLYYLNDIWDLPDLHAKIYIKHCKQTACTEVWIGSANFTTCAFSHKNSEILSCLKYEDTDGSVFGALASSFAQEEIWKKMDDNKAGLEDTDEVKGKKILIPVEVYRELDKQLKVIPKRIDSTSQWEHCYDEIQIQDVCIKEINPQISHPTRNGSVTFKYIKDNETVEGCFSYDLTCKIREEKLREEYEKSLKEHILSECKERNDRLLTRKDFVGIRKLKTDDSKETKKNTGIPTGRKATLFDVILQKKMYTTKEGIKAYLSEYLDNYIGELGEKEKQLIKILMGEIFNG